MARNSLMAFAIGVAVIAVFLQKSKCEKSKLNGEFFLHIVARFGR